MSEDLNTLCDLIVQASLEQYEADPTYEIECPFYILFRDGKMIVGQNEDPMIDVLGMGDEECQITKMLIGALADSMAADAFAYVSEGWLSKNFVPSDRRDSAGLRQPEVMPRDDPNRIECLIVYLGNRTGDRVSRFWELKKNDAGEFQSLEEMDPGCDEVYNRWDLWKTRDEMLGDHSVLVE